MSTKPRWQVYTFMLCFGASVVSIPGIGCRETGKTVSTLGSEFQQGFTEKDRIAILDVTKQIQTVQTEFTSKYGDDKAEEISSANIMAASLGDLNFGLEQMNNGLSKIDVSRCPEDFRQQFYKYKTDFASVAQSSDEFFLFFRDHRNDDTGDPQGQITRLKYRLDDAINRSDSDVSELWAIAHKNGL